MSIVDYAKAIIKNIEVRLTKKVTKLPARSETFMSQDCKPELDATAKLYPYEIIMYQELIGELQWAIGISRIEILHGVSGIFHIKLHLGTAICNKSFMFLPS